MGFFEHLEELRRRLIITLIAVAVGAGIGLYFARTIYLLISIPIRQSFQALGMEHRLIFTSPGAPLKIYLEVGLLAGLVLVIPVVLWQLWLFVTPGLYRHERRFVLPFVLFASGLFMLGVAFAYRIALPIMLKFLIGLGIQDFQAFISINEYLSLALMILLWLGVVFEIPVLIFFLSLVGVVTPGFLWRYFRHAILVIAILAAAITPTTDVITMTVFAVPMIILYLVGIGVSYLVVRRRGTAAARADATQ
ncbi:MAG: twin-arginine translocase subunit TatC [Terriglobia bacterium]